MWEQFCRASDLSTFAENFRMSLSYSNVLLVVLLSFSAFACGNKKDAAPGKATSGNRALDSINLLIDADPQNPDLYAGRAAFFLANGSYDNAIKDLREAILLDSMQPAYYSLLTDVQMEYFKSWQALRSIQKAAELFPEHIPTLLKLSKTQLILKLHGESLKSVDRVLKIDNNNADAHFLLGMNMKETGDTARAINSFQKAVNINSDLIDGWINLGQLHETKGHAVAGKYYETAVQVAGDNPLALHAKADFLSRSNDLNGAIDLYKKIQAMQPDYKEAWFNAGLIYLDMDSIAEAYRQFDQAVVVSPLNVRAYFYRGYCAEQRGNKEQAEQDYRKALSFAPDYADALAGLERVKQPR